MSKCKITLEHNFETYQTTCNAYYLAFIKGLNLAYSSYNMEEYYSKCRSLDDFVEESIQNGECSKERTVSEFIITIEYDGIIKSFECDSYMFITFQNTSEATFQTKVDMSLSPMDPLKARFIAKGMLDNIKDSC